MHLKPFFACFPRWGKLSKTMMRMKLSVFFLFAACMNLSAYSNAQVITLAEKDASLQKVFRLIYKQTGYQFFYEDALLDEAGKIDINVKNSSLDETLKICFKDLPLSYAIVNKTIVVNAKKPKKSEGPVLKEPTNPVLPFPIRGRITNEEGEPLIGVNVITSESQRGTITDLNGDYFLEAEDADKNLVFSYIGYLTQTVAIEGRSVIDVVLKDQSVELQEVRVTAISTGYQQLPAERSAGSFSTVRSDEFKNKSISMNVIDRLEGLVPGLAVNYGRNADKFLLRGLTSVNADRSPLYVVDGVPIYSPSILTSMINPEDVATVNFLRDATAASIWGAAAANGVIVITTKKGRTSTTPQRIQVNYNGFVSLKGQPDLDYYNLMDSRQLVQTGRDIFDAAAYPWNVVTTAASNNALPVVAPHEQVLYDQLRGLISSNVAQQRFDSLSNQNNREQINNFLYQPSLLTNHSLSFNGGSSFHSYYGSIAYTRDEGFNRTNTDRYQMNLRQDFIFSEAIKLDLTTNIAFENSERFLLTDFPGTANTVLPYAMLEDNAGNPLSMAYLLRHDPFRNISESQSRINLDYIPLLEPNNTQNSTNNLTARINAGLSVKLFKGLTYEGRAQYQRASGDGYEYYNENAYRVRNERVFFTQAATTAGGNPTYYLPSTGGHYLTNNSTQYAWTARNQLVYDNAIAKKHQITLLAGTEVRADYVNRLATFKRGFDFQTLTYPYIDEQFLAATGVTNPVNFQPGRTLNLLQVNQHTYSEVERRFFSLYGNSAYTFDRKYSLNASIRMDQSNLFGSDPSIQYRPVWSAGVAWNISNESFFKSKLVNNLKIRATYGLAGNAPVPGQGGPYDIVGARNNAIFAGLGTGYVIFTPKNELLTWERTATTNLGIDFGFWNDRLSGSVDIYDKQTGDLLGFVPIDPTTGFSYAYDNLGSLSNKGIEVQLNSLIIKAKDFNWRTTLTLSYNKNEILSLKRSIALSVSNKMAGNLIEGYSAFPIFGYDYIGLDKNGNPLALNANKDTLKLTNQAKVNDPLYAGTTQPLWYGGLTNSFSYKNLSLSFLIVYNLGHQMRLDVNRFYTGRLINNIPANFGDRWKKEGDELTTNVPKYIANSANSTSQRSTALYTQAYSNIVDASYAKLRDLTLTYNFEKVMLGRLSMRDLSIYGQVNNVLLWTGNDANIDPEYYDLQQGIRTDRMPAFYTIGIRASFK